MQRHANEPLGVSHACNKRLLQEGSTGREEHVARGREAPVVKNTLTLVPDVHALPALCLGALLPFPLLPPGVQPYSCSLVERPRKFTRYTQEGAGDQNCLPSLCSSPSFSPKSISPTSRLYLTDDVYNDFAGGHAFHRQADPRVAHASPSLTSTLLGIHGNITPTLTGNISERAASKDLHSQQDSFSSNTALRITTAPEICAVEALMELKCCCIAAGTKPQQ